jgi:hypothetical protein
MQVASVARLRPPANDLVKSFLGRPQAIDAFKGWMNQEFQGLPAGSQPPSGQ